MKKKIIIILTLNTLVFLLSSITYAFTPAEWVNAHNKFRRRHIDTPDVKWSSTVAASAQQWADTCIWKHSGGPYGENMAQGGFSSAEEVVEYWYEEIADYDFNNPGFSMSTGHFTQVVWKNTTEIGCGYCSKCGHYVCQYNPPGNYSGQFPANVKPEKPPGGWGNILWYHVWGVCGVWYMNGAKYKSAAWAGFVPDTNWQITGAADFNNDYQTDILWRNAGTGQNVIWFMNGNQLKSQLAIDNVPDTNWKIVGTGDFNGDGRVDILWRHATNHETLIWLMDGVKRTSTVYLPKSTHPDWKIVGAGDFNADYNTDILWRNTANGSNAVWYIAGAKYQGTDYLSSGTKLDWEVGATGDLNDDGKTDILWRNTKTGANAVWYMDGITLKTYDWLPPVVDLNWKMVGTGNFE